MIFLLLKMCLFRIDSLRRSMMLILDFGILFCRFTIDASDVKEWRAALSLSDLINTGAIHSMSSFFLFGNSATCQILAHLVRR